MSLVKVIFAKNRATTKDLSGDLEKKLTLWKKDELKKKNIIIVENATTAMSNVGWALTVIYHIKLLIKKEILIERISKPKKKIKKLTYAGMLSERRNREAHAIYVRNRMLVDREEHAIRIMRAQEDARNLINARGQVLANAGLIDAATRARARAREVDIATEQAYEEARRRRIARYDNEF